MKPFDLQEAKLGKHVLSERGYFGRYIGEIKAAHGFIHVFAMRTGQGDETVCMYNENGHSKRNNFFGPLAHMMPETSTKFVNMFRRAAGERPYCGAQLYDTRDEAHDAARSDDAYAYTVPVEIGD